MWSLLVAFKALGRCMQNSNRAAHFTIEKIVTTSRVRLSLRSVVVGRSKVESKRDKQSKICATAQQTFNAQRPTSNAEWNE